MSEKNFKKGKYYIGDPCYAVKEHKNWLDLLERTNYFSDLYEEDEDKQQYKGYPILAGATSYGDGEYKDNQGRTYFVDAGLIGIMPIECIDNRYDIDDLGNIIEFEHDFNVKIEDGIFVFDNITINTRDEDEDEEDYDEYDY